MNPRLPCPTHELAQKINVWLIVVMLMAVGYGVSQTSVLGQTHRSLVWPVSASRSSPSPDSLLAPTAAFSFTRYYVDTQYGGNGKPGWVKTGDMDGDQDLDLVAGGGQALFVYENDGTAGGWTRYGSLDGSGQIGANGGILYDVDGDTDLDVVSAQYESDLVWWENPGPPLSHSPWTSHTLSDESRYLHDMIRVDLDGDGLAQELVANLNQGYWNANITVKWFRPGSDPTQLWEAHTIESDRNEGSTHAHAGLDVGDIDGDGHTDLAYSNGWYEAPDDPGGTWTWHPVSDVYGISNALLRDMDRDGDLDLLVSAGHHGDGVYWYQAPDDPITGTWVQHTLDDQILHPECLAALDLDADDDLDVVTCDLDFDRWDQEVHSVYVFENLGGSTSWGQQNVAPNSYPSHQLQVVDVNQDGLMDIISEATGHSVISYYENVTSGTIPVTAKPSITPNGGVFVAPVSVTLASSTPEAEIRYTLDGTAPVTGSALYTQPLLLASDVTLKARALKSGYSPSDVASASFVFASGGSFDFSLQVVDDDYPGNGKPGWSASGDLDGDGQIDIVSGGGGAIQWYRAPTWTRYPIENGSLAGGNGGLVLDVDRDQDLDVVAALYNDDLVWWENPGPGSVTAPWSRHTIDGAIASYNHDLAHGDLDGDGENEIVALYVGEDGVVWYDLPSNPASDSFSRTQILASVSDPYVGLALGDLDEDLDLDVVASNKWYERPVDPFMPNWTERTLIADSVQNVFCQDVNGDGRVDVVGAEGFEHPNGRVLWAEAPADPKTQPWIEHVVSDTLDGPENIWVGDLDSDGDVEIVTAEMGTSTGYGDNDSNFIVFEGLDPAGTSWTGHIVEENVGVSARINPTDIDGDGDVDFTADGNAENHIYLWLNGSHASGAWRVYLPLILSH